MWGDDRVRFGFGEVEARKSGLDQDRDGGSRIVVISRVEVVTISLVFLCCFFFLWWWDCGDEVRKKLRALPKVSSHFPRRRNPLLRQ